ncbi:predicted protein, partial [Nematostella vectensis]
MHLKSQRVPNRTRSNGDQIWFYYIMETPLHLLIKPLKNIFNWTMSYRRDSEIFVPYGRYAPLEAGDMVTPVDISYKDMLVAWMVSNCHSSERNNYVFELRKYVTVNIYGYCGTYTCPKSRSCGEQLRRYKFYLALENKNCKDYITEKYWENALANGVVPIVMGGAEYWDPHLAVPNSYIDVRDFESPKALAEYLVYLDNNLQAYMKYFQWRNNYKLVATRRACIMCQQLRDRGLYDPPRVITDMTQKLPKSDCNQLNLLNTTARPVVTYSSNDALEWMTHQSELPGNIIDVSEVNNSIVTVID